MTETSDTSSETKPDLPVYTNARSDIHKAFTDLGRGLALAPMWIHLTFQEMLGEFRRFFFGVFWIPLGMTIFVLALGYVYAYIRQYNYSDFVPYLAAGMLAWQFMHSSTMSGMNLFTRSSAHILNVNLPYSYFSFKLVFRQIVELVMVFFVFLAVAIYFGLPFTPTMLLAVPGILLYIVTAVFVILIMSVLTIRFRDLETPVSYAFRVLFLVTPILWLLEDRAGSRRAAFVQYNPFFHYLEIVRAPLLNQTPEALNWYVSAGCSCGLILVGHIVFIRARAKIPYWL